MQTVNKLPPWPAFWSGLIKALLFGAFYVAGVLSSTQLSQYTISSQRDRIDTLEHETALQQLQINELNRIANENSRNLKTLEAIRQELSEVKTEISKLKGLHK